MRERLILYGAAQQAAKPRGAVPAANMTTQCIKNLCGHGQPLAYDISTQHPIYLIAGILPDSSPVNHNCARISQWGRAVAQTIQKKLQGIQLCCCKHTTPSYTMKLLPAQGVPTCKPWVYLHTELLRLACKPARQLTEGCPQTNIAMESHHSSSRDSRTTTHHQMAALYISSRAARKVLAPCY